MGGIIALIIICAILVIALVLNRPASTKEKKNPSEELSLVDKMRKEKEQEKPSSPEEHATENEFEDEQSDATENEFENEQPDATENEFGDEQPDAVTKNAKLFLKDKVLAIHDSGLYCKWVTINLEDIVRVVDEEGTLGEVYTRTLYPESRKIETKEEHLSIGSSQHDYYEYMDPGSCFCIYTKDSRYYIDYDEKEVNIIWGWIVDYFNAKSYKKICYERYTTVCDEVRVGSGKHLQYEEGERFIDEDGQYCEVKAVSRLDSCCAFEDWSVHINVYDPNQLTEDEIATWGKNNPNTERG